MTTTSTQHTGVDHERWKFIAATLAVLGLTATVVQRIAFAYYDLDGHVTLRWSTGGMVALLGAIYMGYEARSWSRWGRIIWVWIVITAFLAYVAALLVTTAAAGAASALRPASGSTPVTGTASEDRTPSPP